MLRIVNKPDEIVAARLVELLAQNAHWHRSLWTLSIGLTISELLEACSALESGALSEPSLRRLGSLCMRMAGRDPVLIEQEKALVNEHLRSVPRLDGLAFHALQQLRDRIEADYLLRWSRVFRTSERYGAERAARSIAAYLLDREFSETFLHGWFRQKLRVDPNTWTLSDLCEEAHSSIATKGPADFEVLIAFKYSPRSASGYPSAWLNAHQVSQWLRMNDFDVSGIRSSGGLVLRVEARDSFAAADLAVGLADSYVARASIATGHNLGPLEYLWVRGHSDPFPYQAKRRGVRVKALYREDQIFSGPKNSNVDAAIELLAHLENSSPSVAVAGGWGAIEALLAEPADRASAADTLGALVACSVPRAELTLLSHTVERTSPNLAGPLRGGCPEMC